MEKPWFIVAGDGGVWFGTGGNLFVGENNANGAEGFWNNSVGWAFQVTALGNSKVSRNIVLNDAGICSSMTTCPGGAGSPTLTTSCPAGDFAAWLPNINQPNTDVSAAPPGTMYYLTTDPNGNVIPAVQENCVPTIIYCCPS